MPDDRVSRPGSLAPVRIGRGRAGYLATRLGRALRDRRQAAGLPQRLIGQRSGLTQQEVSRLERGLGSDTAIHLWAAVGAAVGLQFTAFFEQAAGATPPLDLQHLRGQNLIVATATPGGWTATPESLLVGDGPRPRSIDVLLVRDSRREAAVVELWDLLLDGGAAMRGLATKVEATRERLGPGWRVEGLLVVRGTARNRALVHELGDLFDARYPASSSAWLRALSSPVTDMPDGSGFAWMDVRGTRLIAARR